MNFRGNILSWLTGLYLIIFLAPVTGIGKSRPQMTSSGDDGDAGAFVIHPSPQSTRLDLRVLRNFIWSNWKQHRRAYCEVSDCRVKGCSRYNLSIFPDRQGKWNVLIHWMSQSEKTRKDIEFSTLSRLRRGLSARDRRKAGRWAYPSEAEINPELFYLKLENEQGQKVIY